MIAISENAAVRTLRLDQGHPLQQLVASSIERLQLSGVQVRVENQDVVLTGEVCSWYEKQLAQESVRAVQPALRIYNHISVGLN